MTRSLLSAAVLCAVVTDSFEAGAGEIDNKDGGFSWTGLYLGVFAGGASGASTQTTEPVRLDNLNYWFRPFSSSYGYRNSSSVIAGGTIGYNLQMSSAPLIFGVEAEYGYLKESGASLDANQFPYALLSGNTVANIGRHWTTIGADYGYGVLGVRAGYAFDRLLVYVKAGGAFTGIKTAYDSVKTEDNITPLPNISTYSAIDNIGFAVGGGLEFAPKFLENVSLKAEYLYLGVNNVQPTNGYCSCHFQWRTIDQISGVHTAKFGINYRFRGLTL
jgi:outer membrane immunogenic protein